MKMLEGNRWAEARGALWVFKGKEGGGTDMNQQLSILFEPFRLKGLELKNRLVMAPMHTKFASESGEVTDRLLAYLVERARGGVELTPQNTCIDWVYGRPAGNPVTIHDDTGRLLRTQQHPPGAPLLRCPNRDTTPAHGPTESAVHTLPGGLQP